MGRLSAHTNAEGRTCRISRDAFGCVTAVTNAFGLCVLSAAYDAAGNETWRIDGEGNTVTNTYDLADNLTKRLTQSHEGHQEEEFFTYDLMNNLLTASNAALHRLTSLSAGSAGVPPAPVSMQYDALGNRVVADGRIWIPDHSAPFKCPLIEATLNGSPVRYYILEPGRLLGFINAQTEELTVAHSDEQGSVIALTSAGGAVLHTAHYGPPRRGLGPDRRQPHALRVARRLGRPEDRRP